VTVTIGKLRN